MQLNAAIFIQHLITHFCVCVCTLIFYDAQCLPENRWTFVWYFCVSSLLSVYVHVCIPGLHICVGTKSWKFTILVGTNSLYGDKIPNPTGLKEFLETQNVVLVSKLQLGFGQGQAFILDGFC